MQPDGSGGGGAAVRLRVWRRCMGLFVLLGLMLPMVLGAAWWVLRD